MSKQNRQKICKCRFCRVSWDGSSYNKWIQQTSIKGVQYYAWVGGKDDPLTTVQEIKIWPHWQMV